MYEICIGSQYCLLTKYISRFEVFVVSQFNSHSFITDRKHVLSYKFPLIFIICQSGFHLLGW